MIMQLKLLLLFVFFAVVCECQADPDELDDENHDDEGDEKFDIIKTPLTNTEIRCIKNPNVCEKKCKSYYDHCVKKGHNDFYCSLTVPCLTKCRRHICKQIGRGK